MHQQALFTHNFFLSKAFQKTFEARVMFGYETKPKNKYHLLEARIDINIFWK